MITVIVIALVVYLAFHIGHVHAHRRYRRRLGMDPRLTWSSAMGPWGSIRLPGGFRVGHRL
jgi:hypothetical protein